MSHSNNFQLSCGHSRRYDSCFIFAVLAREKLWCLVMTSEMKQIATKCAAVVLCVGMALRTTGAEFFATPQGTAQGNGSHLLPWDIVTALADNTKTQSVNNVVKPGDTVWLRGGTYGTGSNWLVTSKLIGTSNQPIILRQYSGERAVVDGGISAQGAWTTFWGFEIMNSSTNRSVTTDYRPPGINLLGLGHKCINLIIHDVGHPGIGAWENVGDGGEIYGCILWGNGIYSADPGWNGAPRGSAIYAQNANGSRYISDVISFKNFTAGMKAYTEQSHAEGFNIIGNVSFENCSGGYEINAIHHSITNAVLVNNIGYNNGQCWFGWADQTNHTHLLLANNTFVNEIIGGTYWYPFMLANWVNLTMTNNVFVLTTTSSAKDTALFWRLYQGTGTYIFDHNTYHGNGWAGGFDGWNINNSRKTFAQIQAIGWETNGTYHVNLPTGNVAVLRANKYERGRAHLVVLNWLTNISTSVDISSVGLQSGERYEVRDVQDYLATPALSATYDATHPVISVRLNLTNCSQFIGDQHHYRRDPNLHTDPVFNAFVVLPVTRQKIPNLGSPIDLHFVPSQ